MRTEARAVSGPTAARFELCAVARLVLDATLRGRVEGAAANGWLTGRAGGGGGAGTGLPTTPRRVGERGRRPGRQGRSGGHPARLATATSRQFSGAWPQPAPSTGSLTHYMPRLTLRRSLARLIKKRPCSLKADLADRASRVGRPLHRRRPRKPSLSRRAPIDYCSAFLALKSRGG